MKLRQISFKIISMVMVFAMMFSISATTISAVAEGMDDGHDHVIENEKIYVSLGDSMTNGYGLEGYEPNGENYYGFLVDSAEEAYPEEVAKHFGWNLIQLATSGLRADDIYYLLNYGTENAVEWDDYGTLYIVDKFDPRYNGTREEIIAQAAAKYQESIKAADVISVNVGSNNFATLMHMRMSYIIGLITGNNTMFGGYDGEFDFNELVGDLTPEVKAEIAELYDKLHAELFAYVEKSGIPADYVLNETTNVTLGWVLEDLAKAAAYTTAGFVVGFSGIMETINRENPTAEVIVVELANWFSGRVFEIPVEGSEPIIINAGDLFDELYNYANSYMALIASQYSIGAVFDKTPDQLGEHIGVVTDELPAQKIYFAEIDDVELIVDAIVKNSNIDLDALYAIEDENERFAAALEIAKSIDSSMIPAGTTRIRLLERLGDMVIGAMGLRVPDLDDVDMFEKYLAGTFEYATENVHTIKVLSKQLGNIQIHEETINAYLDNANLYIEDKYNAIANEIYIEDYLDDTQKIEIASGDPARIGAVLGSVLPEVIGNIIYNGVYGYQGGCIAYLGLEKSMIASTNLEALNVTDLSLVTDMGVLMDYVFSKLDGHMGSPDEIAAAMIADSKLMTVDNIIFSFLIGDGVILHPSVDGHQVIADAIIEAYENDYTAQDKTLGDIILAVNALKDFVVEYYDDAYAYAYAELKAEGYIDAAVAGVEEAIKAVKALKAEVEALEVDAEFAETKALILEELALTEATLNHVKSVLGNEVLDEAAIADLKVLVDFLAQHVENIGALSVELGGIALDHIDAQLQIVVANLQVFANEVLTAVVADLEILAIEVSALVYDYLTNTLPEQYKAFVETVTSAIAYYSHEAAKYVYNWLINNPEKVIEFFELYGDDIAGFLADNGEIILGIIFFVADNYGEEILNLLLDNADVIIPAVVEWFSLHGEYVWELITVYFNAIVEYYNLGIDIDFSSLEGIHASFNKIFVLLGQLVADIADGVYDYVESLGIVQQIEAELIKLATYIKGEIRDAINDIKAFAEQKIAEITAQIEAKIAELKAQLETAIGEAKAKLEAEIARLKAELEALVQMEIENAQDAIKALDKVLQVAVKSLGEYIYAEISEFVDDAVRGEFTPTEETYYISINGGYAYYAELLAEALSENLDSDIAYNEMTWDDLDLEELAQADLITIGFDEDEITDFAINQLLAYVANFVDTDIRNNTNAYIGDVFTRLNNAFHEIVDGKFNVDFDFEEYKQPAYDSINGTIDELLSFDLIADKELVDMDWSKFVGEGDTYVDQARAALRAQLIDAGVIETYVYTIDVVAYLYENAESLGIKEALDFINKDYAYEVLGDKAYYDIELPVVDSIVFAAEAFLYGTVDFQVEYGKLILDLYEVNPDATIVLLSAYNAYGYELTIGDLTVDLTPAYAGIAGLHSVQPFIYALLSENVAYVDISEAETVYESYVKEGFDNSLETFLLLYILDSELTQISDAGHEYIYEQILNILTIGCDHKYDNACDAECNKCGAIREVPGHVYDNACDTDCNECGAEREVADHVYNEDGVCIHCGHEISYGPEIPDGPADLDPECAAGNHYFDGCDDTDCYKCGATREAVAHTYDNCEDTECNVCNFGTRVAPGHVYSNACDAECNRCGDTREAAAHVYSGCTDAICNVCAAERKASAHKVDDCTDNECNVCGQKVGAKGHSFGDWTVTTEATRRADGTKVRECSICQLKETKTIAALGGIGGGAIAAIVIGSVVVAGAAGFAIFWFLIQKKTFAALVEAIKGLAGGAAPAAEAAAPAAETEAPAAETEAPAAEEETK